jgi:hypothetical protein
VSGQAFACVLSRAMAMMLAMASLPVQAQDAPADILFVQPHLSGVPSGTELTYRLERLPSDEGRLGPPFGDDIKLTVKSAPASGARDVELQVFTGDRAREPVSMTEMTGNPVLVIFLDRAVSNMAQLTGGSVPYFKGRLRLGLRDKATAEPTSVVFEGRTLDAKRIVVRPFIDDALATRMLGYEGASFEFLVAEGAPGMLLEMTSRFASSLPDAPKLEERIFLKPSWTQP